MTEARKPKHRESKPCMFRSAVEIGRLMGNYTITSLARDAKVSRSHLSAWLKGRKRTFSQGALNRILHSAGFEVRPVSQGDTPCDFVGK